MSEVIEVIELMSCSSNVIVVGDLNLHSVNWNTPTSPDKSENVLLQLLDELGFQAIYIFLTTSSNTLDLVLASNKKSL